MKTKITKCTIQRNYYPNFTTGDVTFYANDKIVFECFSLEQKSNHNIRNASCIDEGVYLCEKDNQGKHRFVRVNDVRGRSAIEMHIANYVDELKGCIALGLGLAYHKKRDDVELQNSGFAFGELSTFDYSYFLLEIGSYVR